MVQEYDGPPRPSDRIAIVRVNGKNGPDVTSVDNQPLRVVLEPSNRVHVEVVPGPHEVDVEVTEPGIGLRHTIPVRFLAAAGKVYRVEVVSVAVTQPSPGVAVDSRWDARAYEVNRDTDARLGVAPAWGPPASAAPPPPQAGPEAPRANPDLDDTRPAPLSAPDAAPPER